MAIKWNDIKWQFLSNFLNTNKFLNLVRFLLVCLRIIQCGYAVIHVFLKEWKEESNDETVSWQSLGGFLSLSPFILLSLWGLMSVKLDLTWLCLIKIDRIGLSSNTVGCECLNFLFLFMNSLFMRMQKY